MSSDESCFVNFMMLLPTFTEGYCCLSKVSRQQYSPCYSASITKSSILIESYVLQQLKQRGRTDNSGSNFDTTVGSCWDLVVCPVKAANFSSPGQALGCSRADLKG